MSRFLETKSQVVILMAKYESSAMVIRELQCSGTRNCSRKACDNINILKIPRNRLRLETVLIQEDLPQANH